MCERGWTNGRYISKPWTVRWLFTRLSASKLHSNYLTFSQKVWPIAFDLRSWCEACDMCLYIWSIRELQHWSLEYDHRDVMISLLPQKFRWQVEPVLWKCTWIHVWKYYRIKWFLCQFCDSNPTLFRNWKWISHAACSVISLRLNDIWFKGLAMKWIGSLLMWAIEWTFLHHKNIHWIFLDKFPKIMSMSIQRGSAIFIN